MAARTPRSESTAQSKRQILEAALDLAVEKGYAGTTMADVSAASGLPIGSVYWHFRNKEQLFVELLEHSFEEWKTVNGTRPATVRDRVERGIAGAAATPPADWTRGEAFLKVAMLLALDKRLGGLGDESVIHQKYVAVRREMFTTIVGHMASFVPDDVVEVFPDLPEQLAVLSLALIDGFYLHASSAVGKDFDRYVGLAGRVVDQTLAEHTALARSEREPVTPRA